MSHQNKKSLIGQADARLQKMTLAGVGRSKHQDKIDDKFPYGKPQTDEVARGSGTESMAVRD